MTLFVDASALVAMIAGEPEGGSMMDRVMHDADPIWSAMTEWETVLALCRSYRYPIERARQEVRDTAAAAALRRVDIGTEESKAALDAYDRYGKGRHEAKLNMGDCFAYACARTNNAELLYKGDDFARTDLR
ncbi:MULTISPECIES: type II toxin-antitoxin system VapC family toxin [Sphingomonas]|uniref:Twitching motility protein PilT n=1 Tax=Sphingomonas hankookensis TaxID=563996 RepID=A0ABR5YDN4_9SPHN|nr:MULTISPECIES: type II toxin-antitoxin system VapC family toxin [Sphingomonas]KZE16293.1 twitching motility protein PilT [Sphingomonas hankookensis]PZT92808.1 MAG: PIN domain nuclease [Sphingomonas sp.]RSV31835.1 type II toxin-antitoxin system VapC family toxin [Sphingomonas sp. ABOLH]WCP71424.1 type II toxin-antitoxin system VapC family toxin [Sphingomonas hankookensis]